MENNNETIKMKKWIKERSEEKQRKGNKLRPNGFKSIQISPNVYARFKSVFLDDLEIFNKNDKKHDF